MPFNYNPQVRYNPMSQATIKAASKSPFEIAGKAMSGLDEAIENRAFNRDIAGVKDLQGLVGLNPQSDKSRALYAAKQSGFNALNQQQIATAKNNALAETLRHNKATEQKGRYKSAVDPITGQTRIFVSLTGSFGLTAGGTGVSSTDSGEPISSKTAVKALPDGTTIYTDRAGNPLTEGGELIVKARSKFNLDQPANISQEQGTVDSINRLATNVEANPDAVGSLGSGAWNYVTNNINDMLKVPTDDRLARNQITSTAGVLAANIRSMFEKGVMTEPDFERYKKLVPNENDSVPEFKHKLVELKAAMVKSFKQKASLQGTEAPSMGEISVNKAGGDTTDARPTIVNANGDTLTLSEDGTKWE